MVDVNNSTSNNSSVLGISSGHGNTASGSASGSTSGISMSSSNIAGAAGASGMTSDLMKSAAAQVYSKYYWNWIDHQDILM